MTSSRQQPPKRDDTFDNPAANPRDGTEIGEYMRALVAQRSEPRANIVPDDIADLVSERSALDDVPSILVSINERLHQLPTDTKRMEYLRGLRTAYEACPTRQAKHRSDRIYRWVLLILTAIAAVGTFKDALAAVWPF
ncbi:MAG: hypothetical protein FD152_1538 [Xanthobacteraceae bacterium]|nr:MAG: hypothetical protein FD152_1538 [Xanthobacteraceae bacterium]